MDILKYDLSKGATPKIKHEEYDPITNYKTPTSFKTPKKKEENKFPFGDPSRDYVVPQIEHLDNNTTS